MTKKITEELALEIKEEFIFGVEKDDGVRQYPSIDTLVKKHGVARASLYRWAEKQDWQAEKNRVQTQISTQIEQDRVKRMVNESKKLDDNALLIAQGMLTNVGRELQKHMASPENQNNPATYLRELSHVAVNAQKLGKLALGQAQEISKVSADVSSPEAFREIMEQLDELAESRASKVNHSIQ